ncbi:MAG: diacylglycerol kinase family lipid kinase [Lachnospiraceae bacterium]|nr:diacylglycerol kinase family lipid kinase [Lachnospiraceae bacterium]
MARKKKLLFIYNPHAGKERIRSQLIDVIDVFAHAGYEVIAHPTRGPGDAKETVLQCPEDVSLVVCCGGDGTLDETVNGMLHVPELLPIGYIPAGSTNDFAVSLRIPARMVPAAKIAVRGNDYKCDVGVMNDALFVYSAAFGLFTKTSYRTGQRMKNLLGHAAYLLQGVTEFADIRSYRMRVRHDGEEIKGSFIFGMITNSVSIGGFREITGKRVRLDDGLFEVTLVKMPKTPAELSSIVAAFVSRSLHSELMVSFKTSRLVLESAEETAWTRDGEYGGTHRRMEIVNRKQAVLFRVPPKRKTLHLGG